MDLNNIDQAFIDQFNAYFDAAIEGGQDGIEELLNILHEMDPELQDLFADYAETNEDSYIAVYEDQKAELENLLLGLDESDPTYADVMASIAELDEIIALCEYYFDEVAALDDEFDLDEGATEVSSEGGTTETVDLNNDYADGEIITLKSNNGTNGVDGYDIYLAEGDQISMVSQSTHGNGNGKTETWILITREDGTQITLRILGEADLTFYGLGSFDLNNLDLPDPFYGDISNGDSGQTIEGENTDDGRPGNGVGLGNNIDETEATDVDINGIDNEGDGETEVEGEGETEGEGAGAGAGINFTPILTTGFNLIESFSKEGLKQESAKVAATKLYGLVKENSVRERAIFIDKFVQELSLKDPEALSTLAPEIKQQFSKEIAIASNISFEEINQDPEFINAKSSVNFTLIQNSATNSAQAANNFILGLPPVLSSAFEKSGAGYMFVGVQKADADVRLEQPEVERSEGPNAPGKDIELSPDAVKELKGQAVTYSHQNGPADTSLQAQYDADRFAIVAEVSLLADLLLKMGRTSAEAFRVKITEYVQNLEPSIQSHVAVVFKAALNDADSVFFYAVSDDPSYFAQYKEMCHGATLDVLEKFNFT